MPDVEMALRLSGLPPTRLEIEITEGVFLENAAEAVANLHALRARGIRVALDDFGTGYSSLNYLTNFPVDKIKIDRSFTSQLMERHENRAIVDVILMLARKLGLRVTAEGVETAEQALALKLRRCDDIQGYLVSKAQPGAAVNAMFAARPARAARRGAGAVRKSARRRRRDAKANCGLNVHKIASSPRMTSIFQITHPRFATRCVTRRPPQAVRVEVRGPGLAGEGHRPELTPAARGGNLTGSWRSYQSDTFSGRSNDREWRIPVSDPRSAPLRAGMTRSSNQASEPARCRSGCRRVTRPASCSSIQPSVSAGRSGMTM